MPRLPEALKAWNTDAFAATLKAELEALPAGALPLQQAVSQGGYVDDSAVTVTVITSGKDWEAITAKVGVFFTEVVASCGCGEEPMPVPAYCVLRVRIGSATGEADFQVVYD